MKSARQSPERPKKRANAGQPATTKRVSRCKSKKAAAAKSYIKTGDVGSFLSDDIPDERLIGSVPKADEAAYTNLLSISKFLADYRAISILHSNPAGPTHHESAPRGTAYYLPTIRYFAQTQRDRQSAGLRTNTNSKTSQGMNQVVESHSNALEAAMEDAESATVKIPSKTTLCQWHGILCHDGKESFFRETLARAGSTVFCPPKQLDHEFTRFSLAMKRLNAKWESKIMQATVTNSQEDAQITSTYYSVALAAISLYGLTDIHMFSDGNGRLSRICTNWMLKRILGLPFTITLAANPQQRREYIDALKQALQSILPQNQKSVRSQSTGIFSPLIHLLLDRMAHAIQECQRKLTEKSEFAIAEDEARIARRVRERAAAGQCIICLDEKPNIATLCCGQAVHLNCVAEWLANASNCVGCRAPLPPMRLQRPQVPQDPDETEIADDDENEAIDQNIRGNLLQIRDTLQGIINRQNDRGEGNSFQPCRCDSGARVHPLCTNGMCVDCCPMVPVLCDFHDPQPDDEATTSIQEATSEAVMAHQLAVAPCRLAGCSQRPAVDCTNAMCGSCCLQFGPHPCRRHGDGEADDDGETTTSFFDPREDAEQPNEENDPEDTTTSFVASEEETTAMGGSYPVEDTTSFVGLGPPSQQQHQVDSYCQGCSNRAAVDCDNAMCGRCCLLNGLHSCPRHNND